MDLDAAPIVITVETWTTDGARSGTREWARWYCSHPDHAGKPWGKPVRGHKARPDVNRHLAIFHPDADVEILTRPREDTP